MDCIYPHLHGNCYIYLIVDNKTGRYYGGSRTAKFLTECDIDPLDDDYMGSPTSKYTTEFQERLKDSPEEFTKIIVDTFSSWNECIKAERQMLLAHGVVNSDKWYNMSVPGDGLRGTSEGAYKRVEKERNDIDSETGLNKLEIKARKGADKRINDVDVDGKNGYDRSKAKTIDTKLNTYIDGKNIYSIGNEKRAETLRSRIDDETKLDGLRTIYLNRAYHQNRPYMMICHEDFGECYFAKDLVLVSGGLLNEKKLKVLAKDGFMKIITKEAYIQSKFLKSLQSDVIGLRWRDLGFYTKPWNDEDFK